MDNCVQYQYELKQSLNDEQQTFIEFMNRVYEFCYGKKLERDQPINILILINSGHQEEEGEDQGKGVTQSLKAFIKKNNSSMNKEINNI